MFRVVSARTQGQGFVAWNTNKLDLLYLIAHNPTSSSISAWVIGDAEIDQSVPAPTVDRMNDLAMRNPERANDPFILFIQEQVINGFFIDVIKRASGNPKSGRKYQPVEHFLPIVTYKALTEANKSDQPLNTHFPEICALISHETQVPNFINNIVDLFLRKQFFDVILKAAFAYMSASGPSFEHLKTPKTIEEIRNFCHIQSLAIRAQLMNICEEPLSKSYKDVENIYVGEMVARLKNPLNYNEAFAEEVRREVRKVDVNSDVKMEPSTEMVGREVANLIVASNNLLYRDVMNVGVTTLRGVRTHPHYEKLAVLVFSDYLTYLETGVVSALVMRVVVLCQYVMDVAVESFIEKIRASRDREISEITTE